MAPESGQQYSSLMEAPWQWDFFQALRHVASRRDGQPPIGYGKHLADDPVRLGQKPTMAFPPADIAGVRRRQDQVVEMETFLFGLLGCSGAMPLSFTEYVFQRIHHFGDHSTSRFLNMFHHRMLCFLYRTWSDANPVVNLGGGSDSFGRFLRSLIGIGTEELAERDSVPDEAKVYFGGLIATGGYHAEGLVRIVEEYFQVPARLQQFIPAWLKLPLESRCCLGRAGCLGNDAFAGEKVRDCRGRFRLILGALSLEEYQKFLPGRAAARELADWVRFYAGFELEWELNLVLGKEEIPEMTLDGTVMLGYTAWLPQTNERARDGDELTLGPFDSMENDNG